MKVHIATFLNLNTILDYFYRPVFNDSDQFQLNFSTFSLRETRETKTRMTDFSLVVVAVVEGAHMVLLNSRDMEYQKHQLLTIGLVMEAK